jgi:hypothetical protein
LADPVSLGSGVAGWTTGCGVVTTGTTGTSAGFGAAAGGVSSTAASGLDSAESLASASL